MTDKELSLPLLDKGVEWAAKAGLHPLAALAGMVVQPDAEGGMAFHPEVLQQVQDHLEELSDSPELRHAVRSVVAVVMTLEQNYGLPDPANRLLKVAETAAPALRRQWVERRAVDNRAEDRGHRAAHVVGRTHRAPRFEAPPKDKPAGFSLQNLFPPSKMSGR